VIGHADQRAEFADVGGPAVADQRAEIGIGGAGLFAVDLSPGKGEFEALEIEGRRCDIDQPRDPALQQIGGARFVDIDPATRSAGTSASESERPVVLKMLRPLIRVTTSGSPRISTVADSPRARGDTWMPGTRCNASTTLLSGSFADVLGDDRVHQLLGIALDRLGRGQAARMPVTMISAGAGVSSVVCAGVACAASGIAKRQAAGRWRSPLLDLVMVPSISFLFLILDDGISAEIKHGFLV
jgi:hypothetical protein